MIRCETRRPSSPSSGLPTNIVIWHLQSKCNWLESLPQQQRHNKKIYAHKYNGIMSSIRDYDTDNINLRICIIIILRYMLHRFPRLGKLNIQYVIKFHLARRIDYSGAASLLYVNVIFDLGWLTLKKSHIHLNLWEFKRVYGAFFLKENCHFLLVHCLYL